MGLVLGGRLHRGAHGAAGEIGYLPLDSGDGSDAEDARRRGRAGGGRVRGRHRARGPPAGHARPVTARQVFAAADARDERAGRVVADEALLVAKAVCAVVAVVDPELVVLGGGVGQAAGFLDAVAREAGPVGPGAAQLRVSAPAPTPSSTGARARHRLGS